MWTHIAPDAPEISDGVHRLHAHRKMGTETTTVEVWAQPMLAPSTSTPCGPPRNQRAIGRLLGIRTGTVNGGLAGYQSRKLTGR